MANEGRFTPEGDVVESLNRLLRPKLQKLGEQEVENIQNDLSVGVEYIGGSIAEDNDTSTKAYKVIRSAEGEAPRREFGQLQRSVHYVIERQANGIVVLEVMAQRTSSDGDPHVAQYLQHQLNRPFMSFSLGRLSQSAPTALKS